MRIRSGSLATGGRPRGGRRDEGSVNLGVTSLPPTVFLEVLILNDFKSFAPEVLILRDFKSLFPEVLILAELKSLVINEMRGIGKFLEVLILGGLSGAKCTNGWI
jgi:hypothetical protein